VQLGAGKPAGALCVCVLSINRPVAMNTAYCLLRIHSPDGCIHGRVSKTHNHFWSAVRIATDTYPHELNVFSFF